MIEKPIKIGSGGLLFLPQRSYTTEGTLRDQIIYPDTRADTKGPVDDDAFLMSILEELELVYLYDRWGWDTPSNWDNQLSGGEAQRMGFARLFFHKPAFAIMVRWDRPDSYSHKKKTQGEGEGEGEGEGGG